MTNEIQSAAEFGDALAYHVDEYDYDQLHLMRDTGKALLAARDSAIEAAARADERRKVLASIEEALAFYSCACLKRVQALLETKS